MLRAVATGMPLVRCPPVMHMYTSILFEHGAEILLYGLYITLIYAVRQTSQRQTEIWRRYPRLATISTLLILFILGSAQIASLFSELLSPCKDVKAVVAYSQTLTYILANLVTGSFFIYRLYVIVAPAKLIIALPLMLGHLFGSSVVMFISTSRAPSGVTSGQSELLKSKFRAFLLYNLVLNTTVSLLIAGRIWQISRRIRAALGSDFARTRATIIAMFLESGSAYPAAIAIYLIALSAREDILYTMLSGGAISAMLTQIAGIVSTAALVQKAHGMSIADIRIEEVESAVTDWSLSGFHFERNIDENSARRSPSLEMTLTAAPDQIEDLEAGKPQE